MITQLENHKKQLNKNSLIVHRQLTFKLFELENSAPREDLENKFLNSQVWRKILNASGIRQLCGKSNINFQEQE